MYKISKKNQQCLTKEMILERTVQRSALYRSRREPSNEYMYLLDEIGVDTADNEPLEVWGENYST